MFLRAGMEPDEQPIEGPVMPPKEKTEAERIREMFGGDGQVFLGIEQASAGTVRVQFVFTSVS